MAIDLSNMELSAAAPIDPEEELAEARAHGFETVKEFYDWMTEAYDQYDIDQQ